MYRAEVIEVTPELAEEWLNRSEGVVVNRSVSNATVAKYTRMLKNGRWHNGNPQTVAIDTRGFVIDGQHRLLAVIEAGVAATFLVAFDCDTDAQAVMDDGRRRGPSDFSGVSREKVAVVRVMTGMRSMGNAEVLEAAAELSEAVDFACDALPKLPRVSLAPVRAVIAMAFYTQDRARLREFGLVLSSGRTDEQYRDGAALRLRDFLLQRKSAGTNKELHVELRDKTAFCLQRFLEGRDVKRVDRASATAPALYPVPGGARG